MNHVCEFRGKVAIQRQAIHRRGVGEGFVEVDLRGAGSV